MLSVRPYSVSSTPTSRRSSSCECCGSVQWGRGSSRGGTSHVSVTSLVEGDEEWCQL